MDPSMFNQRMDGFGQTNSQSLEMLTKALSAGSGVDASTFTGGRAMTPESMDQTLVNVLFNQDEARLFQRLKKKPIKSVVHQWNYRDAVGDDDGAWVPEGGDSIEADQNIQRVYAQAKYLQTKRQVTIQAAVSDMIEDAVAIEKNAGTLWIIRNIEKALFNGNSTNYSNQPDGLDAQIPTSNVLDLRGQSAATSNFENIFNEGTRQIRDSYGKASAFFSSTMVLQDVQQLIRDRIRFQAGATLGSSVFKRYPTPFGDPELIDDIFITERGVPVASSLTSQAPAAPTIGTLAVGAQTGSEFKSTDIGDYYYTVVASNRYGDSVAATATAAQSITAAGQGVSFAITSGGGAAASCYKIYRSQKDGVNTDLRLMETITYTASPQTHIDLNTNLPGCSNGYLLTLDPTYDAIEWFQFLPLMKFELYPTNAAVYPFLMMLFGALAVKKPTQHIRIKNIAPDNLGWF